MALKIKVGMIGLLDMLKFKKQSAVREAHIAKAPLSEVTADFGSNRRAAALHPAVQKMLVRDIIVHSEDVKTYLLKIEDGSPAACFRAGQYVSVILEIDGSRITRPYSICSAPALALAGQYAITVKRTGGGFASGWLLDNWQVGSAVILSDAQGDFYYENMRDARHVVALAGGSGITPFLSMAYAIRDGAEDFDLTILFGSRTVTDVLFKEAFDELCAVCQKVRMINVLSDKQADGYEHGFITAELIRKYAPESEPYSVFICGPEAMYRFTEGEVAKLGLAQKFVRRELLGVTKTPWALPGYPLAYKGQTFKLRVRNCGKDYSVDASADESVLVAIERAGIAAPSRCRSGTCGFCRSKLLSGDVFIPEDNDGRRAADLLHNYIHPCSTFPLSDIEVELPGVYLE